MIGIVKPPSPRERYDAAIALQAQMEHDIAAIPAHALRGERRACKIANLANGKLLSAALELVHVGGWTEADQSAWPELYCRAQRALDDFARRCREYAEDVMWGIA